MSENGTVAATEETSNAEIDTAETTNNETAENAPAETSETIENAEDVSYHTVEKEGTVTAIWEMQGRKHIRTIDPRSSEGNQILELFETAG
ncbi:MAG: hypothetical protein ABR566_01165 [Pyrinomonadaceae bacterium]